MGYSLLFVAIIGTFSIAVSQTITLDGSGTTNPSKFFWEVMSKFEARARPPVKMTYRAVGSGTGQYEFIGQDNPSANGYTPYNQDFGSGDIPISTADRAALVGAGKDILHFPFQMGAMSIFHNIPGLPKSGPKGLNLTACLIAKIFRRQITTWDDANIKAVNPNLQVPAGQNIVVYHRVKGSSTTSGVTTYLRAACPNHWPATLVGKTITWPADTSTAEGSGGMSAGIASTPYSIGYIDSGHGHEDGLKEIELQNAAGKYLSSLEAGAAGIGAAAAAAIQAGIMPSLPDADFGSVSLHNQGGTNTWPIVAISYIYIRKNLAGMNADKACLLKAFLTYIISTEGQALLPAYGAVGIPAAVKTISEAAITSATWPACTAWTFESSSSTQQGAGQAPYVISGKRRSYDEYQVSTLESALTALTSRVGTLEDHGFTPLDGSGTTNPSKFFWQVMSIFEARAKPAVKMTYRAVGSGTGQYEFIGAANSYKAYDQDFGSGDIPIGASDYAALTSANQSIMHFPFQMGAMSIFHNIPGMPKSGAKALKLDACLIARIFRRLITKWDHAQIAAMNAGNDLYDAIPAGTDIIVFHRVHGSSTTAGVTTYLNAACPSFWPSNLVGKTITWNAGTRTAEGSGGMSSNIASTPYSIGYIDAGHGHEDGLKEIELKNKDGQYLSSLQAGAAGIGAAATAAIAAGVMPSSPLSSFENVSLHNMAGATTWPIVAISYIYVRKDQQAQGAKACLLKAYLEYIISNEGQALLPAFGAVGVPSQVKSIAQAAINALMMPACSPWTFETATIKGGGQADYIISKKRRSYDEYSLSNLVSSVTALISRVSALEDMKVSMLDGSGTTNPSKFIWQVMSLFEARAKPAVKMTYRAVGSSTGQYEFIGAANNYNPYSQDFGSGDIPLSAADHAALVTAGHEVMHIPFQMGAMSIFHNIPGLPKSGVLGLNLTACLIAKIFKRSIKTWDDPQITAVNPGLSVPANQNIKVYHRVLGSSTTSGVTTYLNAACPAEWDSTLVGKTITWPSDTFTAQGSGGMSAAISANQYSIGYIDSGHGHTDGLKEIELQNKDGTYQSSLEAGAAGIGAAATAAIAAGIMPATPISSFDQVSLHNQGGANTWPIVAISYIYVRKNQSKNGEKACLLKAFLEFILSNEGQALLPAFGAVGVPTAVKNIANSGIGMMVLPACKQWTFESSTNKGGGQADYIISKKRRSYYEYDDSTEAPTITSLANDVAILKGGPSSSGMSIQAELDSLKSQISTLQTQLAGTPAPVAATKTDDDDTDTIGIVALIVSIVALLLGCGATGLTFKAGGKGGKAGGGEAGTSIGHAHGV